MTTPIATASTNVYTVTFDGQAVCVFAKRRQTLLRRIPLSELTAVEFKPSRGIGGGRLRFRTTMPASSRDTIFFRANQQPDLERLAEVVQRYLQTRPAVDASLPPLMEPGDPWPPIPYVVQPVPVQMAYQRSGAEKWSDRFMAGYLGLSLIPLLGVALLVVVICGICGWMAIRDMTT